MNRKEISADARHALADAGIAFACIQFGAWLSRQPCVGSSGGAWSALEEHILSEGWE